MAISYTRHTHSALILQKQDEHNIHVIMKIKRPPDYHHNGFVATHALRHMMYGSYIYKYILKQTIVFRLEWSICKIAHIII